MHSRSRSRLRRLASQIPEKVPFHASPFRLMLGKILGIASVAVVQVLIWGVLVFN